MGSGSSGETDIQVIKPSELFPKKPAWVEGGSANTTPPFPLLPGEDIAYEVIRISYITEKMFLTLSFAVGAYCGGNLIHYQLSVVSL